MKTLKIDLYGDVGDPAGIDPAKVVALLRNGFALARPESSGTSLLLSSVLLILNLVFLGLSVRTYRAFAGRDTALPG